jgi:deoxyribodipyrimidine photolyase-related protein
VRRVFICFGNQLFHPRYLSAYRDATFVLVEDPAACTRYAYHKQKLVLIIAAMRAYARTLRERGFDVRHYELSQNRSWRDAVTDVVASVGADTVCHFEVEVPGLGESIRRFGAQSGVRVEVMRTPMFLDTVADFADHLAQYQTPQMQAFYRDQRLRKGILLTAQGEPVGGRWTFDQDNRAKLPRSIRPPEPKILTSPLVREAKVVVSQRFPDHPGTLDGFWVPTTHAQADAWLENFLIERLGHFGTYEDALTERSSFVFHSGLAPLLNIGLLTPDQVVDRVMDYAAHEDVPVNSLEGFIRQIIGWREFVRGVFHHYYNPMQSRNIWNAKRKLTAAWYDGTTGIAPLDHVIDKSVRLGWAHHIERLMVAANLMNLSGIQPQDVYRWFMEMFVDAYDWVMVPNVFGMGLSSEGGIFTTKPYICGSNYVLKMGDFKRGEWCNVMDGLLWRFVANHEQTLRANHRLAPMVANLARVARKRPDIFELADAFIEQTTEAA